MSPVSEELPMKSPPGQSCYVPRRYVFTGVLFLGVFMNIILMTSLPLSITVMVRRNSTGSSGGGQVDSCPAPTTTAPAAPAADNATNTSAASTAPTTTGDYDWSELSQSMVLSAGSYGSLISTMIGGRIAELWSPKHMFSICYATSVVIHLLLPVMADWSVVAVIVGQAIGGFISGPLQPVMMAMCAAWFPREERQLLFAITMSAVSVGSITCGFLIGNLLQSLGWRFVFYLWASLVAAWILPWMFLVYDSPQNHPNISKEELKYITENTGGDKSQAVKKLPWKQILTSPPVWAYIVMGLPSQWMSSTLSTFTPTYMRNILHFNTAEIGNITAVSTIVSLTSSIFFGFLSQWLRKKKYLSRLATYHVFNGISSFFPAALLIAITQVGCDAWAVVVLLAAQGVASAAYIGGSQLNQMDLAVNYTSTIVGLATTINGVLAIIAPLIVGAITNNRQTLGAWSTIFYITAGVKVVPFFVFLMFGSVDEQPWNRTAQEEKDDKEIPLQATV
ncbi:sialin-like [Bacillus rossius redtenbacheri]|uniref:sialin-like n=1 Tax=Bacillus rossius redtenbacheri TaxID=93214 RepID=UPI002FDE8C98